MSVEIAVAALAAAAATVLAVPGARVRLGSALADGGPDRSEQDGEGRLHRFAWPVSLAAGVGAWLFLGGVGGLIGGVVVTAVCLRTIRRSEDPGARRRREAAAAQLPHLVLLLASALRGGSPPAAALAVVCAALPGPAADRLDVVRARLALGLDPVSVWEAVTADATLAPLARTMSRAGRSGVPVADAVERLAIDLADRDRSAREDRARAVGVRAALPLGLCLLPSFLLLGIVPLVAGLFTEVTR